jgi:TonB family protein
MRNQDRLYGPLRRYRLRFFVSAAVLVHLGGLGVLDRLLGAGLLFAGAGVPSGRPTVAAPIEVALVPATRDQAEIDAEAESERKKKLAAERELEDDRASTFVDLYEPPKVEIRNPDAKRNARFDSKVEKETVRRGDLPRQAGVYSTMPPAEKPAQEPPPRNVAPGLTADGLSPSARGRGAAVGGLGPVVVPGLSVDSAGTLPTGQGPNLGAGPGAGEDGGGARPGTPKLENLRPTQATLAGAGIGSYDALPDVDEGEKTLLDTKRFKHATFFTRLGRSIKQAWHPAEILSLRDPSGKVYGFKDRLTVLKVSLKPDGHLVNVIVEKPCGVDFLDDEAVRAMKQAAPFPNPPAALVDATSRLITFRFGFHVTFDNGPSWKVFRYDD